MSGPETRLRAVVSAAADVPGAVTLRLACGHMIRMAGGPAPARLACPACPRDGRRYSDDEQARRSSAMRFTDRAAFDALPPLANKQGDRRRIAAAEQGSWALLRALRQAGVTAAPGA
ncbi:MAG: hypothetical protein AB7O91_03985 [Sphingomonas sp.]